MEQTPFDDNLSFALGCGALRYALGRQSIAVYMIIDAITDRLPLFGVSDLAMMGKELEHSLRHDLAGEDCDRTQWAMLLEKIRDEEGKRR